MQEGTKKNKTKNSDGSEREMHPVFVGVCGKGGGRGDCGGGGGERLLVIGTVNLDVGGSRGVTTIATKLQSMCLLNFIIFFCLFLLLCSNHKQSFGDVN